MKAVVGNFEFSIKICNLNETKGGGNCNTGICSGGTLIVYCGAFAYSLKASFSFVMSVCLSGILSAYISSASAGRLFVKFDIGNFYESRRRKSKFG
jgi:hypothetical protein